MNFWEKAKDLMPVVMAWNSEVAAFLRREPAPRTLAVTY
ncbi:MAG: hypothetical protein UY77_C0034G0020 [Candidatus Uhrbacteria bacterium GW2011_GWA2_53_10]|uniref:Uncharacterized protein n=1 Tax=Candidatus Uhrbacteria bacterium GW2011_GWA2_53_10 TaxID=1618980 RepID=A0A0G1XMR5_9BACT|nr:MAG: hypothetical protein UY77_C0034G0020 [Candidatus Uhrbacteria bacterium GW2011_GWA2_53_10]